MTQNDNALKTTIGNRPRQKEDFALPKSLQHKKPSNDRSYHHHNSTRPAKRDGNLFQFLVVICLTNSDQKNKGIGHCFVLVPMNWDG